MKKILALSVLAVAALSANAGVYVGGSLGVGYEDNEKKTTFTLAPEVGGNVSENWAVGGVLNYTLTNWDGDTNMNEFTLQPYVRWTFARVANDKLGFFVDGAIGIGINRYDDGDTGFMWNIGFKPGISYSFNEHWSVVAHIGFLGYNGYNDEYKDAYAKVNPKADPLSDRFGLDFSSMNLNFGLYYTF